jgi:dTDP-4-dehydrorhamnose 3,5-epimerase
VSERKFGLEGVQTYDVKIIPDERGFFSEALRQDWKGFLGDDWAAQVNLSYSYPGVVRAWHRHLRGQVDYFLVVKGAMKICAYEDSEKSPAKGGLTEVVTSEDRPQIVRIPGHYWHGTKTVGWEPSLTVYFVTKLYDYKSPDEERRPWNDATIVPTSVNGKTSDSRVGKPWDWFYPIHK